MSGESMDAAELREQITEHIAYSAERSEPLEAHAVKKFGKLAIIDPHWARDKVEDITHAGSQVNASLQIGERTRWRGITGDIGPAVDAWYIAQGEIYRSREGARPLDAGMDGKKGRKLHFLFQHALPLDEDLAIEIAESIENPSWRARSLLELAVTTGDPAPLAQVDLIAKREKVGKEVNDGLMMAARGMGEYRLGINAIERRIDQQMAHPQRSIRSYGATHAKKDWSIYVLSCVRDATENDHRKKLLPISDEVAEAFAIYAERQTSSTKLETQHTYSSLRPGWHGFSTDSIAEITGLAKLFRDQDPEASIKLLQVARTFINVQIKDNKQYLAEKSARERERARLLSRRQKQQKSSSANQDAGLLDLDEIADELAIDLRPSGYGAEFDADLAAMERIGRGETTPADSSS